MSATSKRIRYPEKPDPFDTLPDDLLISVLSNLCSSSSSPSDFINALSVCKRFNRIGLNPIVLSTATSGVLSIRAEKWSDSAHRFIKKCVRAGSIDATYFLGMIRFYCMGSRGSGSSLMAKAAMRCHAPSLYSLAVIQFNGSGGTKNERDLRAGVALCARAAYLGHVDSLKELGHCLQDGYGVRRNIVEGRRILVKANAHELASTIKTFKYLGSGHNLDTQQAHPANLFLMEWFGVSSGLSKMGLDMCSYSGCGRPETRPHEFRSCSACGVAKYCSRGCQAHDWNLRHKAECSQVAHLVAAQDAVVGS